MPKRYFENIFSDSHESVLSFSYDFWKDKVSSLTECVAQNAFLSSKNTVYTGTTGIAYMFYRLAIADEYKNNSSFFLNKATQVLKLKENNYEQNRVSQFMSGDAGVNAVSAVIYHLVGNVGMAKMYLDRFKNGVAKCKSSSSLKPGEDELFVGRAGYLFGVLWLEKVFGKTILADQDIIDLCVTIVESGRKYSKINNSIFPLMYSYHNKEYLGAAHGLCTILQVLLSFPQFVLKEQNVMLEIKKCIDVLISLQTANGNFPTKMVGLESNQRSEEDELVHWCHGAPGVIYLLAKAYLVFKEPSYLECCLKCGDLVWEKGLLKKGPGLCHGVAGNGYVFLLLYRLTGETKQLNRAIKFGEFIFSNDFIQGSKIPDHLYSLYEGLAGTVCYLSDLMQPEKASFPFLDVF